MTEKKRGPGRPPNPPATPAIPEGIPPGHQETLAEEAQLHVIAQKMSDERDLVHVLIGQYQMASAVGKLLTVGSLLKLREIKEGKLYQSLKGKLLTTPDGKTADGGTWDGFCQVLGSSRSKVDEDLTNLDTFGPDALDSMSRAGIGVREFRKLRALPAPARDDLIAGVKVDLNDPEDIKAAIEDVVAKHESVKQDLEASRERVKKKDEKLEQLEEQVLHQGHYKTFEHFVRHSRLEGQVIVTDALKVVKKLPALAKRIDQQDLTKFKESGEQEVIRSYAAESYMAAVAELFLRVQDVVHDAFHRFGNDFDPAMNERIPFAATKFETSEELRAWIHEEWRRIRELEVGELRKAMRGEQKAD